MLAETLADAWRVDEAVEAYGRYQAAATDDAQRRRATDALAKLRTEIPEPRTLDAKGRVASRTLLDQAQRRQASGDYEGAAQLFERAFTVSADPKLLALIGRTHEKRAQPAVAARYYARAIGLAESAGRSKRALVPKLVTRYTSGVRALAFSPDGKLLAIGSADATVRVWDLVRDEEILTSSDFIDSVSSVAFNADGTLLAVGSRDGTAQVLEVTTGHQVQKIQWPSAINAIAFEPGDQRIATAGEGAAVRMWNLETGKRELVLPGRSGEITALAYAPATHRCACLPAARRTECASVPPRPLLVAATTNGTLEVWEGGGDAELRLRAFAIDKSAVTALDFNSNGTQLALSTGGGSTLVLGTCEDTWAKPRRLAKHGLRTTAVAFSSDDRLVFSAGADGARNGSVAYVADMTGIISGKRTAREAAFRGEIRAIAAHPLLPGRMAAGDDEGELRVIDESGSSRALSDTSIVPYDLSATSDGSVLVQCGNDRNVWRWDVARGERVSLAKLERHVVQCQISPSGKLVAAVGGNQVKVVELAGGREVASFELTCGPEAVALAADDNQLITGCRDGTVTVFDVGKRSVVARMDKKRADHHTSAVVQIRYVPGTPRFATASSDKTVRVWDAQTFAQVGAPLGGFTRPVSALAISVDGHRIAAAGQDSYARVYDLRAPQAAPLQILGHHTIRFSEDDARTVRELAFTPDGAQLLSMGWDQTMRSAKLADATPTSTVIERFSSPGRSLAFARDGKLLYAQSRDGLVRVYAMTGAKYELRATLLGVGRDWVATTPAGHVDASPDAPKQPGGARFVMWAAGSSTFRNYVAWNVHVRPGLVTSVLAAIQ